MWWLSLGFKDDLVCSPIQWTLEWLCSPGWICRVQRQVGHWKAVVLAGEEASLWWWSWDASCSACCSFPAMHLLYAWVHTSLGGPGLLHWVWKAWCHTTSGCSSVCLCRCFHCQPSWVFLVLGHQKTAAFGLCSSPIEMMWLDQRSWVFSSITLMEDDLAQSRTLRLVILSCHWNTQDGIESLHVELLQMFDLIAPTYICLNIYLHS